MRTWSSSSVAAAKNPLDSTSYTDRIKCHGIGRNLSSDGILAFSCRYSKSKNNIRRGAELCPRTYLIIPASVMRTA